MKIRQKLIGSILLTSMLFSLTACNDSADKNNTESPKQESQTVNKEESVTEERIFTNLCNADINYVNNAFHSNAVLDYSKDGKYVIASQDEFAKAKEDIVIKSVDVPNVKDSSVEAVTIIVKNDEHSFEYKLDGKNQIVIPQGSYFDFKIEMQSDKMINSIGFYVVPLVRVQYTVDGKDETVFWEGSCNMKAFDAYEVYAVNYDKIDIFDYYANSEEE